MALNWGIPFFTGVVILLAIIIAQMLTRESFRRRVAAYRRSYMDLVARLEQQTVRLNVVAAEMNRQTHAQYLEPFEMVVGQFESLLALTHDIAPFGSDRSVLKSAHFLLQDFSERLRILAMGMHQGKENPWDNKTFTELHNRPFPLGCYFCSRPFVYTGLKKVRARVEGRAQLVHSCAFCCAELKAKKRVAVLYFVKDEKPVHWSLMKEYNPIRDFWAVQKQNGQNKATNLRLVQSDSLEDDLN